MGRSTFIPQWMRREAARRANNTCEYCRLQQALCPEEFEIDHVMPRAAGGPTELANLCLACPVCNNAKRSQVTGVDPVTGRRTRLFNPRGDHWDRHFGWSNDFGRLVGKTRVGRATVVALDMNRPRVIQIRRLWTILGLHPPA